MMNFVSVDAFVFVSFIQFIILIHTSLYANIYIIT